MQKQPEKVEKFNKDLINLKGGSLSRPKTAALRKTTQSQSASNLRTSAASLQMPKTMQASPSNDKDMRDSGDKFFSTGFGSTMSQKKIGLLSPPQLKSLEAIKSSQAFVPKISS